MEYFYKYLEDKSIYLNEKQKEIVAWKNGQLLVLACPGSGKTTVLNARIAYMLKVMGIDPKNILALTFSRAAAKEMNDRFNRIYEDIIDTPIAFSTIHAFCFRILRSFYKKTNIKYELIEGSGSRFDKRMILKEIYKGINQKTINDDKLEDLLSGISAIKNTLTGDIDFADYNIPNLKKIYLQYEKYRTNNKYGLLLLDFDDLLLEGYKLLRDNKYYRDNCRRYYKYILVDEGQDTSLIQNKVIEIIAEEHKNLFIVCDDDQSIYRFRGADPEYLLSFKERYPNGDIINLDINYRSTSSIVDTARGFIQNNRNRYDKDIYTHNKAGDRVKIVNLNSYNSQIKYILDTLDEFPRVQTAILYRNNISSVELANELMSKGISYYIRDYHRGFFNHWVLNDILNVMRFTWNDSSIVLLESIYTKIDSYISKAELNYIKEIKTDASVFDKLITFPEMKEFKKRNMKELKSIFQSFRDMEPLSIIRFIRHQFNYDARIKKYGELAGYSYENLRLILNAIEGIARDTKDIQGFVDRLNDLKLSMHEARNNKNSLVTLSTLHSSKGLEFDRVIMYDLFDEIIPTKESINKFEQGCSKDIEEDRRLWYVGMTRARYDLRLLKVKSDFYDKSSSRFFGELTHQDSIEIINQGTSGAVALNSAIKHTAFGQGIIEDIGDDLITVLFEGGNRKTLSLRTCIENKLIDII